MDLWFARMLRISEAVRGASVDLNQRLTGWVLCLTVGRGFRAVVGMFLPHSTGISASLWASLRRGKAQAWRGWIFLMKELPCGCIFTLQDVTTPQLSTDIDKAKCDLEALHNVKIGCGSNHLSYCSKTAYSIRKEKTKTTKKHFAC